MFLSIRRLSSGSAFSVMFKFFVNAIIVVHNLSRRILTGVHFSADLLTSQSVLVTIHVNHESFNATLSHLSTFNSVELMVSEFPAFDIMLADSAKLNLLPSSGLNFSVAPIIFFKY